MVDFCFSVHFHFHLQLSLTFSPFPFWALDHPLVRTYPYNYFRPSAKLCMNIRLRCACEGLRVHLYYNSWKFLCMAPRALWATCLSVGVRRV